MNFFATTPKGLELLLAEELRELGAASASEKLAGVVFSGDLEVAYKACLWSRFANRILLPLATFKAETPDELYSGVQTILWDEHLEVDGTLTIHFVSSHSQISHTLFGAQKVKDAIVDQFREKYQKRPSVADENPDLAIHVYLQRDQATISIDLSGESLHKRGYRLEQGAAPLKENLAAAILTRANWKNLSAEKKMLLDPMCGSGTLLIEGAWIAADIAPGLMRDYFGFLKWKKHDETIWNELIQDAKLRREKGLLTLPKIIGWDEEPRAITISFSNIERAGLKGKIHVEKKSLAEAFAPEPQGLFVTNPPYGERLGEFPFLPKLYELMGEKLKKEFAGWQAAVFTGNPELGKTMGLRAKKTYALFNGAIPCQLLLFDVESQYFVDRSPEARNARRIFKAQKSLTESDKKSAEMFLNRIKKNLKKIKSQHGSCFRIYDADLPEYAVSVDFYNDYVCVQEYPAPKTVDPTKAAMRLNHILAVLPDALAIPPKQIFLKTFSKDHYDLNDLENFYKITDQGKTFLINLTEPQYPVGFLPDQFVIQNWIRKNSQGKTFLNLFSHSGEMSVVASASGAETTSLCENEFYAEWTRQNFSLNHLTGKVIVADWSEWITKQKSRYDIIFIELPRSTFHLRKAHPEFLADISTLLSPQGQLKIVNYDPKFKP